MGKKFEKDGICRSPTMGGRALQTKIGTTATILKKKISFGCKDSKKLQLISK